MIKVRKSWELPESEVTPEPIFRRRRAIIRAAGTIGSALLVNPLAALQASLPIDKYQAVAVTLDEELSPEDDVTSDI